jgi:hypothetical protein
MNRRFLSRRATGTGADSLSSAADKAASCKRARTFDFRIRHSP